MNEPSPNPIVEACFELVQRGQLENALELIAWPARRRVPRALALEGYLLSKRGQPGDLAAAVDRWKQAANLGDLAAHFGLAVAFASGRGVDSDALGAYTHLLAAHSEFQMPAEVERRLRASLTELEIQMATAMAEVIGPK